jgi:hypothetical protein
MRFKLTFFTLFLALFSLAQNPAITSFLQNTSQTGSYYVAGNPNLIDNGILVNCQRVEYSEDYSYVTTQGIPSYPTGPFQDGNPSQATSQNKILQIPLNPQVNSSSDPTIGGNIGVFINGVSLFDYRDGVAWNSATNSLCGGPGNPPCPGGPMATMDWNRDAIPAEMEGFDCSKGHPAMGNYHHHQNPSAFKLDLEVVSNICNLYDADGLYVINENQHSPLIGFAYDGFPIYGSYGFKNSDGTGGIERIKSSYQLRDITNRTEHADGTNVDDGPDVDETYFLGFFREDYEFIDYSQPDYLDSHNGRFCITPEYPDGIYAYFATVDENWNSAYPYVVGPTFYGEFNNLEVNTVDEITTVYVPTINISKELEKVSIEIFPNPAAQLIAIQIDNLVNEDLLVDLIDINARVIKSTKILKGSTIAYFDVQTVYSGTYIVKVYANGVERNEQLIIAKD